jgi:hypothetical protein
MKKRGTQNQSRNWESRKQKSNQPGRKETQKAQNFLTAKYANGDFEQQGNKGTDAKKIL